MLWGVDIVVLQLHFFTSWKEIFRSEMHIRFCLRNIFFKNTQEFWRLDKHFCSMMALIQNTLRLRNSVNWLNGGLGSNTRLDYFTSAIAPKVGRAVSQVKLLLQFAIRFSYFLIGKNFQKQLWPQKNSHNQGHQSILVILRYFGKELEVANCSRLGILPPMLTGSNKQLLDQDWNQR